MEETFKGGLSRSMQSAQRLVILTRGPNVSPSVQMTKRGVTVATSPHFGTMLQWNGTAIRPLWLPEVRGYIDGNCFIAMLLQ